MAGFREGTETAILFLNWFELALFREAATACMAAPSTDFPTSLGRRIITGLRIRLVAPVPESVVCCDVGPVFFVGEAFFVSGGFGVFCWSFTSFTFAGGDSIRRF